MLSVFHFAFIRDAMMGSCALTVILLNKSDFLFLIYDLQAFLLNDVRCISHSSLKSLKFARVTFAFVYLQIGSCKIKAFPLNVYDISLHRFV